MNPDSARTNEETATQRRANLLRLDYYNTSGKEVKQIYKGILPAAQLYQLRVVPISCDKSNILFGITTTTSQQTMNSLVKHFTDQRITFTIISDTGYRDYMRLYDPPKEVVYKDIKISENISNEALSSISIILDQVRPDDILAYLVKQAYQLKASDIHLENQKDYIRIRFRVDVVLHSIAILCAEKYHALLSTVAIAANISTSSDKAQTGHINKKYTLATGEEVTVNLRVETVPTAYGQDIVMRLFTVSVELLKLDNLGLSEAQRKVVDDIINHPSGMVLVVGPTGSGKTTTLYSLISTLNSDERKIITLEDPIEYFIPGIVQTPVEGDQNATGFAERLRAVLRLDPDVVMIGEIRDQDTARTALQSALTGHLVLSTFHASSASAALMRLLDFIGINPLFASAIHLVMAQRLIRRLDDNTKVPYQPDEGLKNQIKAIVATLPPNVGRPNVDNMTFYKPGVSADNPFGYRGQMAIREQLQMTNGVQQLLRLPPNQITTDMIEKRAIEDGMVTMQQDGILKVLAGLTTLEEIYRVVG
jgi:type II secretory ATPase GspE/PulE/Tfp pilus assembly ATPase PilB-like protein